LKILKIRFWRIALLKKVSDMLRGICIHMFNGLTVCRNIDLYTRQQYLSTWRIVYQLSYMFYPFVFLSPMCFGQWLVNIVRYYICTP